MHSVQYISARNEILVAKKTCNATFVYIQSVNLYLCPRFHICLVLQQVCRDRFAFTKDRPVESGVATRISFIYISSTFQQETHTLLCLALYGLSGLRQEIDGKF